MEWVFRQEHSDFTADAHQNGARADEGQCIPVQPTEIYEICSIEEND
jgi:hypothetical protein